MWFHSRIEKDPWCIVGNDHEKIFFPTSKFQNEKDVNLKHKFSPKQNEKYFWMKYPHFLEFRRKVRVTIYCSFDFSTFPFDSHECNLSYGMNFFSETYIHMMNLTVVHKKKQTAMGDLPILCKHYIVIK